MNSQILRILAIALAIGAVVLGYLGLQLSKAPGGQVKEERQTAELADNQSAIIIAKQDLKTGSPIKDEDLDSILVPVRREGAFYTTEKLVDQVPAVPIKAGEIVLESHFQAGSHMARLLDAGMRAVAINVSEVVGSGGYVQPGDYVDVLLYLRGGTAEIKHSVARTLIEHVQVLAYGKALGVSKNGHVTRTDENDPRAEPASRSAVLAVPRSQVEKLMLADNAGVIRLAVVSSADTITSTHDDSPNSKAIGIDSLTNSKNRIQQEASKRQANIPIYRGTNRTFEAVSR